MAMRARVSRSRTSRIGPGSAARSPSIIVGSGCTKSPTSRLGRWSCVGIPRDGASGAPARWSGVAGTDGSSANARRPARCLPHRCRAAHAAVSLSASGAARAAGRRTARSDGRSRGGPSPRPRRRAAGRPVAAEEGSAEQGDLARDRHVLGAERRPGDALVEPVQAARADARELVGGRLVLDDDGDRAEPLDERVGQAVDRSVDRRVEAVVDRVSSSSAPRPRRSSAATVGHPIPPTKAPSTRTGTRSVASSSAARSTSAANPRPISSRPDAALARWRRSQPVSARPEGRRGRPRLRRQLRAARPWPGWRRPPSRSSTAGRSAAVRPALAGRDDRADAAVRRRPGGRPPTRCGGSPPRPSRPALAGLDRARGPVRRRQDEVSPGPQRAEARRATASARTRLRFGLASVAPIDLACAPALPSRTAYGATRAPCSIAIETCGRERQDVDHDDETDDRRQGPDAGQAPVEAAAEAVLVERPRPRRPGRTRTPAFVARVEATADRR